MTIQEINYSNFGRCIQLSNGIAELVITIDVGPRIIRYALCGGENVMFEDTDRQLSQSGSAFDEYYNHGDTWYIYGGHRLWTSPEALPRSYYPDNTPVRYEEIHGGVRLIPSEQKRNGLQMMMEVRLAADSSKVEVNHIIQNTGAWDATYAIWALTVMGAGGKEVVPVPQKDTELLANRAIALWPYAKMTDPRVHWGDKYITLRQDPQAPCPFKFGINNEDGYAMYFINGDLFVKQFSPIAGAVYPDGGMSFETYTNPNMLEIETLSPLTTLAPGQSVSHAESWQLFGNVACPSDDEAELDGVVKRYIG